MIPSLVVKRFACGFLVFVVAKHHIQSASKYFSRNIFRVMAVDFHFHVQGCFTARAWNELPPVFITNNRSTFCCPIANGIRESDAVEELFHLLVEGGTADNNLLESSAEGIHHLRANLFPHLFANHGHAHKQAHTIVLYLGEHLFPDNLLDNQWHRDDDCRTNIGKRLCNNGW